MRHRCLSALCCLVLAGCTSGAGGAFVVPSPTPGASAPAGPAHLDAAALTALRSRLLAALAGHAGGHVDVAWGSGQPAEPAGPYPGAQPWADAIGRLAGVAAGSQSDPGAVVGPELGSLYLLAARGLGTRSASPPSCPAPPATSSPECSATRASDLLLAQWYARDTRTFFHVGETTTVYRPVDAIGVGCALVVAGFREQSFDKIDAGQAIITTELKNDFDPHYGFAYGMMRASAGGRRAATDFTTRIADQAGIAEVLLQAFDASREQQYQAGAAQALGPLLQEPVALRGTGYLFGFDVQGAGPAAGPPDLVATLLVLQAAHHYDAGDGNHYARLEETAGAALLDVTRALDTTQGLPATLTAAPSMRSGMITALGVVVLGDALGAAPTPAAT